MPATIMIASVEQVTFAVTPLAISEFAYLSEEVRG
jgi:hypothetical protein